MFTGIIEEVGQVTHIRQGAQSCVLTVRAPHVATDLSLGDSVATNGVCLTVAQLHDDGFSADVMHETLRRSSLGSLRAGSEVNLERAMSATSRFDGHIVSGHIDGTGRIVAIRHDDNAVWFRIAAPPSILRLMVEKGSIALDGISLTVAELYESSFSVSTIPHTRKSTNLPSRQVGDVVNLENDLIGKYVERLLSTGSYTPRFTDSMAAYF